MQKNRFIVAVSLILFGSLLATFVQTDGGNIRVQDVRFAGSAGNLMSGHLYIPAGVDAANPAPAILAIHGYINTRETQSGFAIEFARRGFVVLALDQTGHGYSDPPAFANAFGGPDGLAYLRTLAFVDKDRIGLEGHSMGGWAVQLAAATWPDHYASMVLEGSSTGTFGAPAGTPTTPKNLLVVFSLFDEFSGFMWGAPVPADIVETDKLKNLFGTRQSVEPGVLYGDIAQGTARKLAMPAVTHPGDHLSRDAIGAAVDWFELTLDHKADLASDEQVWYFKELGTLIALLGLAGLMFPLVEWLVGVLGYTGARTTPFSEPVGPRAVLNVVFAMFLPIVTFFPLQVFAPAWSLLPQQITNGILMWAWGTGLVMLLAFWLWYRGQQLTLADLGLPLAKKPILNGLVLAGSCCAILYLIVLGVDFFFNVDFRFWVVAVKAMSRDQIVMFLIYLPWFTVFFGILALSLTTQMPRRATLSGQMLFNGGVLSAGFVVLLLAQYIPLLLGGTMLIASQPLLTIVAFQFVPLLFLVGLVLTFCHDKTGHLYTGIFLSSLFVTWYIVAGTATQAVPWWF
ncbi:MAG: alpha/beta fold hydrolase [Pseudomonadales bacterium]